MLLLSSLYLGNLKHNAIKKLDLGHGGAESKLTKLAPYSKVLSQGAEYLNNMMLLNQTFSLRTSSYFSSMK